MSSPAGGPSENKGIMGNMGGMVDKITGFPDRFQSSAARRTARIALSCLLIFAGLFLFFMMKGNVGVADPSLMNLTTTVATLGLASVGAAYLLEDISGIFGNKVQRNVGRIMGLAMPILFIGGTLAIGGAGFHSGILANSFNRWFFLSLVMLPVSVFSVVNAIEILEDAGKDENIFLGGRTPDTQSTTKKTRKEESQRIERSEKQSQRLSRRTREQINYARQAYKHRFGKPKSPSESEAEAIEMNEFS